MMDFKQITPLNLAISNRSFTITKMLLHHSTAHLSQPRLVDMDARDHPLCLAVGMGLKDIVQILIVHGADVTVRNRRGQPLLHQAARKGHDVIRQLLSYERVSINETDSGGRTPLHYAALHGRKSTIMLLLRTPGVDIDVCDNDRATPLCMAARENHWSVAWEILAEEPADINASCQTTVRQESRPSMNRSADCQQGIKPHCHHWWERQHE
jgi:ankyrin repeat protein